MNIVLCRLRVKAFGPILSGYTETADGYFNVSRVSMLCGPQGTGKSTIAKLVSVFSWLEKALVRGDFSERELAQYNRFVKKYCSYQNLQNYFSDSTELGYYGQAYEFNYSRNRLSISRLKDTKYTRPKIMYVPAERNFMSAVSDPEKLRNLPSTLYTLLAEYDNAKQGLTQKETKLPISRASFAYDKQNKISWIQESGYRIRLQEASSGLQSFLPLFLVSQYLSTAIGRAEDNTKSAISLQESSRLASEVERILKNQKLTPELREAVISRLIAASVNSRFVNIVEEPEQNLYPVSQREVLFDLLTCMNRNDQNSLLMTTHSPYMISWLTLAMKAGQLSKKGIPAEAIESIVPRGAWIDPSQVAVFQLTDRGSIELLDSYEGLPSDSNILNVEISEGNELFGRLLDLEESS